MNILTTGLAILLIGQAGYQPAPDWMLRKITDVPPGVYYMTPYGGKTVQYIVTIMEPNHVAQGAPEYLVMTPAEAHKVRTASGQTMLPDPTIYYPGEPLPIQYVPVPSSQLQQPPSQTTIINAPAPFIPPVMNYPKF